jgi:thiosulfate/3-mercaptopyruvate sulfurtransferase
VGEYAHPKTLVDTEWLADHLGDDDLVVVEVDVDTDAYSRGHVPGAVGWDWRQQLCDTVERDIISGEELEQLLGQSGIGNGTTIILYGDSNNWFACWAFWQLKIYGHEDVRLLDGGRKKWVAEQRPLSVDAPTVELAEYRAREEDHSTRAFLSLVMKDYVSPSCSLVDVRSFDEYTGEVLSPPGLAETCQRGGHIPNARSIPWVENCNEDGTFKSFDDLKAIYEAEGVTDDRKIITYCRIGERSSLSWFVLKYLLGYSDVLNYDGSWTEWGNLVGAPIEKGA